MGEVEYAAMWEKMQSERKRVSEREKTGGG